MAKDKKQKIVLSAILVLAVFIWARALKNRDRPYFRTKDVTKIGSVPIFKMAAGPRRREKTKSAYSGWGRNPFVFGVSGEGKIILQGILSDKEDSRALINDHYVKEGDRVDEYIVVDIRQDKVILNDGTNDKELSLGE